MKGASAMRTKASTVGDVMTRRVIAVRQDAEFREIVTVLRQYRVSAVPVLSRDNRVIGVVSECDLLYKETDPDLPVGTFRLAWRLREPGKANAVTAAELMTSPAVTVSTDTSAREAARLMQQHHVKRLPVITDEGALAGIVSRVDVLSVYERPDDEIWIEVLGLFAETPGVQPNMLSISVRAGIVTVAGPVEDRGPALRLLGMVSHLEGVVAVRDRLTYPPESGQASDIEED
jgi:CBS domain-containing protein